MLTHNEIDAFYKRVDALDLRFPVAAISEATGESKANVSKILNRKMIPSANFLKRFNDKFPANSSKNVSRDTPLQGNAQKDPERQYITLMQTFLDHLKKENEWLQRNFETSLAGLVVGQKSIQAHLAVILDKDDERDAAGNKAKAERLKGETGRRIDEVISGRTAQGSVTGGS